MKNAKEKIKLREPLKTGFSVSKTSDDVYILVRSLTNALGRVSVHWERDGSGAFRLVSYRLPEEGNWNPVNAGLAVVYNFLNDSISGDTPVCFVKIMYDTIDKEERREETQKQIKDFAIRVEFSNQEAQCACDENLQKGAAVFCLLEQILLETSADDFQKIGRAEMIPRSAALTFCQKNTRKMGNVWHGSDKKGNRHKEWQAKDQFSGATFSIRIDYKIDFLRKDKVRVFFRAVTENGEKAIQVLYCIGQECGDVSQRIRKTEKKAQAQLFAAGKTIRLHPDPDWEINTTGNNTIIQDFAPRVPANLAVFLDVSEQFVRAQKFEALWELCKASS